MPAPRRENDFQFLLSLVRDEFGAQFFGVRVDEETQLGDDREPNVVRPDGEVVVLAVGCNGCADEAILRGVGGGAFGWSGGEGGLEECATLFGFSPAGSF